MKTAILYARHSPRPDENSCESCDRQLERLREYCNQEQVTIIAQHADAALSGADAVADRPGLAKALSQLRRGNVLLIEAYSRLSRDEYQLKGLLSDITAKGCAVFSITEPQANGVSDEAWLMRGLLALIDDYERRRTKARTSGRMIQHQNSGRAMSKLPPYGWIDGPLNENGQRTLVKCPTEQKAVLKIIGLHRQGFGTGEIASILTNENFACRNKRWYHGTIAKIIKRERRRKTA